MRQKDEVRKTLGYLPQEFGGYPKVSAEDLLGHFALLKGIAERRARREVVARSAGSMTRTPDYVHVTTRRPE